VQLAPVRGEDVFPLVPRHRLHGLELGPFQSVRRGPGSDTAGSRGYLPGDDVRSIDWGASARLSAARGADEFVVRERYAEQAPRVIALPDRRAAMGLYAPPWLSKPAVVAHALRLIGESAFTARGLMGTMSVGAGGHVDWQPPTGNVREWRARARSASLHAPADNLELALERLHDARALPAGSFLFVLSDFLVPPPGSAWVAAVGRGWDVVPVVIQDPLWEASFPVDLGGLVLPVADPVTGAVAPVRLTRREALARREQHEERRHALLEGFGELGLDWVEIDDDDPDEILRRFLGWAAARTAPIGRVA